MTKKYLFSPGVLLPTYTYMEFHSKQNQKGNFSFFTMPYCVVAKAQGVRGRHDGQAPDVVHWLKPEVLGSEKQAAKKAVRGECLTRKFP